MAEDWDGADAATLPGGEQHWRLFARRAFWFGEIRIGFDQRPFFELAGDRFYVDYTIGSKWQQGYVTKLRDGRMQVLPIEYNRLEKKWINYWAMIDPPGSERAVIKDFPKMSAATNYQQNCAICHTSPLKAAESLEKATFLQPGIDCEMCHGRIGLACERSGHSAG